MGSMPYYLEDPIIPGLPDDVATLCLARVPREKFPTMGLVSKLWRKVIQSKDFHQTRIEAGKLEEQLYVLTVYEDVQNTRWLAYIPSKGRWVSLPPMPGGPKNGFNYAVIDQQLFVIGGLCMKANNAVVSSEVYKYDYALNWWTKVASMHTARSDFACAVLGGLVYVVGGQGASDCLASVEMYDPEEDIWTELLPLKRPRWGAFACALGGKLHILGGRSNLIIGSHRQIDVYDPQSKKWEQIRSGCNMVVTHTVLQDFLYCVEWKDECKLVVFNQADNVWKRISMPILSSVKHNFCLGSLNGKLFLFPTKDCPTLVYDPQAKDGQEWQISPIRSAGLCICCASIAA